MRQCRLFILAIALCLLLDIASGFAAETKKGKKNPLVTQGEFVSDLVTALGWEAGLPPKPRESDYLAILSGNRSFKFEAENYYAEKTDNVSVRKYALFGPFTGSGWVSGIAVPTTAHFRVFLPIGGTYSLIVAAKGDGQKWQLGGKEFTVSTGSRLTEKKVAEVSLNAGYQEINVVIPPDGAVDYFLLDAPTLRAIEPVNGWNLKTVFTHGELAEVTAVLLGLEGNLPDEGKPLAFSVADVIELPPTAKITTADYMGKPLSKKWARAGYGGAQLEVPFSVDKEGSYRVRIRALGNTISAGMDDFKVKVNGKQYLDWIDLGIFRLGQGKHKLTIDLSTNQGVDVVEVTGKRSAPADYMTVSAVPGDPSAPVKSTEEDKILASLAERFKERQ
ncbi:hypothetical protein [Geotalea sp. SG265]|uniref:hypothetical protein n=1 Tax=Geotalea sp. SG265 TaxID=2922867 RepID=UPI001FAEC8FD|nr:hypothetical protein [Geotalea sp. SG265]